MYFHLFFTILLFRKQILCFDNNACYIFISSYDIFILLKCYVEIKEMAYVCFRSSDSLRNVYSLRIKLLLNLFVTGLLQENVMYLLCSYDKLVYEGYQYGKAV